MAARFNVVISNRLKHAGNKKTKDWWESYMKGVIPFYGVNLVDVRSIVKEEYADHGHADLTLEERFDIGLSLFEGEYAEDKLAGILYLEYFVAPSLDVGSLKALERLFHKELIYDWNICDWFCVRVLEQIVVGSKQAAVSVSKWSRTDYLWQARAGLVGFVNLVAMTDSKYDFHRDLVLNATPLLIKRDERFSKTAVGWTLGEMGKVWPEKVAGFVEKYEIYFTAEVKKRALKNISMS